MGFAGFLRFLILCFDFLAWPAFALGYPLWASIRAIETSSKYHMKKLVTYWTVFSLISLFEIMFAKLVQWVPFWSYVKLIAICWLVIPRFNGACQVYQYLVHPCLSLNLKHVTYWFSNPKENLSMKETFLASVEAFLEENGSEALEKLIASKAKCEEHIVSDAVEVVKKVEPSAKDVAAEEQLAKCKEHIVSDALEVVKRVEPSAKDVAAEEELVQQPQPDIDQTWKKIEAAEIQNVKIPAESEEKRPLEILAPKNVQMEWTCAMCQVTTSSEANLNSHLCGRKHRLKCEELKTSIKTAKNMRSSALKANDPDQANKEPKHCAPGEGSNHKTTGKPENLHISGASGQYTQENPKKKDTSVDSQQSRLWCGICNIRCPGEIAMAAHLKGRKHLDQIQSKNSPPKIDTSVGSQQSRLWCGICNIRCPGEIDMAAHLKGRKHLDQIQCRNSPLSGGKA